MRAIQFLAENPEQRQAYRQQALDQAGGKCIRCGFNDCRALQFDHVQGGGRYSPVKNLYSPYGVRSVLKRVKAGELQVLCANCNWIKKSERNENPNPRRFGSNNWRGEL